jgi:RNA polymerase sigma-70 factor, ECF subfamily
MPLNCKRGVAIALHGTPTKATNPRFHALGREGAQGASRLGDRNAMQATSDEVLIEQIAHGDRLAMHVLYARYRVGVYRFVLRFLRDEAMAEDVVSEVFLDVWRQADRFEGRSGVLTWMLAIARCKAFSALRRPAQDELDERIAGAIEDPADDPVIILQKQDTRAIIRGCLRKLSADHREIIDLVYYHEKSIAEVAEIVGIPANTVKTRMFCARKHLARLLKAAGISRA